MTIWGRRRLSGFRGAGLALGLLLALGPYSLEAAEIKICAQCKIKTLQAGVKAAASGDVLLLQPGVYKEGTVEIDKSLSILGTGMPTVDGLKKGHVFYIRADNVTISGLKIINSGESFISDFSGIRVEHGNNCKFTGNRLLRTTYAIYLSKVSGCLIENNFTSGGASREVTSGNGVHLFYSDHITVRHNRLTHQRDGLYFEFTEDSEITDNICEDNIRYGMHFMFSHRNKFLRNQFLRNQTGVAIMYSRRLLIRNNRFERSWGGAFYGILLKEVTDSRIERNRFYGNTTGMRVEGANRNLFKENDFISNGWAARVQSNSLNNLFTRNNFISNQFDMATNSSQNTNTFKENYWQRYSGYDMGRDGIGDVPYRPVTAFSFWVGKYPELSILLNSPVIRFLEIAERVFPVLTPKSLEDQSPLMKKLEIPFYVHNTKN